MNLDGCQELSYSILDSDHSDYFLSILIESGPFGGYKFGIQNLRLVYEDEQGELQMITDEMNIDEKDLRLDFQVSLYHLPETVLSESDVDLEAFDTTARGLVFDIIMNHQNLYNVGAS